MYLTFKQYQSLGGALKKAEFTRHEYAARKDIDFHTFGRLQGVNPVPEELKMCVMELVERSYCGALNGQDATSASTGKVSLSLESNKGKAEALIKDWLSGEEIDGIPLIDMGGISFSPVVRV